MAKITVGVTEGQDEPHRRVADAFTTECCTSVHNSIRFPHPRWTALSGRGGEKEALGR